MQRQQQQLNQLGSFIRANLGNTSVSQASLDMGFSPSYLGQVINGQIENPSIDKLKRIAEYLDVDFRTLSALAAGTPTEKHASLQELLSSVIARIPLSTDVPDVDTDRRMSLTLDGQEYRIAVPISAREYTADDIVRMVRQLVGLL